MSASTEFWADRTVMVTGGSGFLGTHLVERLKSRSDEVEVFVPESNTYDLREKTNIRRAFRESGADTVIHLAATVGGIGANLENPGAYFYDNAKMGIELIEQARQFDVDKFTTIGTVCSYPKRAPVPFSEGDLFEGYPEETNAPYGIAKKALLTQLWAYRREYGFNGVYLIPVNLYGPRDDFDLKTSHVIPAIIRKCVAAREADKDAITAWGTGEPTREFLYVTDAAEGILDATERYQGREPVNLGSGREISIRKLVHLIADIVGFDGEIHWDTSKPDGQPRRKLDNSRAKEQFGWEATTPLRDGIAKTVDWYEANRQDITEN